MTKNVLILTGSPRRKGNSDLLSLEFMRGAKEAGHTVEMIRVADKNIRYCLGCGACAKTGKCVQTDDMAGILDKMLAADVLVFATPVYFYSMSGQMKTLIDRTVPQYTALSDKEVYFIITAADTDKSMMEKVIEALRGLTQDCLDGTRERGIIYGLGVHEAGAVASTPAMQEAYEMGKKV